MRIAHLNLSPLTGDIRSVLARFPVMQRFAQEQARLGHEVHLLVRSDRDSSWDEEGAHFRTFAGVRRAPALARAFQRVQRLRPGVVHTHGTVPNHCVLAAALRASGLGATLAMQDQVTLVPRGARRWVLQAGLGACDVVFFAAAALAEPLVEAGLLSRAQVATMPGGSTDFQPVDRAQARAELGLSGAPLYVWSGRLTEVKAPLLGARAMARVLARNPAARFAMAFREDDLLAQVQAILAPVAGQVTVLGQVPSAQMQAVYSAADVFLLPSRREGYCFALVEAMACGASPVVSDIPASLAAIGAVGVAAPSGDEDALVAALERAPTPRAEVVAHFGARLTYRAMAQAALDGYARG
jgi:glycosyltransferase involved in cell wall biosynthesis